MKLLIPLFKLFYSTLLRFWLVEELAGLANGPTGCGEVAWNVSWTRSTALTEAKRRH